MDLSMRWLSEFVEIDTDAHTFAEDMTMSGSKVEGYQTEAAEVSNVVVGKVLSIVPHENSDHLVICQVEVGKESPVQIVTGATNVVEGALVPVALDGATLPGGVKIKKGKLRGVVSEGMLCSLGELGLTTHDFPYAIEDGIFLIEEECEIGQDIHDAIRLNDTCVEFEITPNRPDCLSVIGLAREAAVTYKKPLRLHEPVVKGSGGDISEYLRVTVENPVLCPRYTAKAVKNVRVKPSPLWMRERLRASGVRPINNLVDITNYVMLEYGQPLHAFDAKYVEGGHIIVRNAHEGEVIETLDGVERKLNPSMLVISDPQKAVAIAGVMGGENSAIMDDTNTVIFESANFLGSSVRVTARGVGLRTDSSARFEKGLDPKNTYKAVMRACELVELLDAGEVVDGIIDVDNSPKEPTVIRFEPEWINRFLGIEVPTEEMVDILTQLGFTVEGDQITVPSFRGDVEHKADIAEEIARFYGYDKIPVTAIRGVAKAQLTPIQKFERTIHQMLQANGCYEVMTYSFISPKYYDKIGLPESSPLRDSVVISNPLGEDTSVMRTTTLPSMLEVLSRNYNNRNASFFGYEIGNEYIKKEGQELPDENAQVTIGLYGDCDFYTLKGMVETLLERLHVKTFDIRPETEHPTFHPGRCAVLFLNDVRIGILGEVHPTVLQSYGIGTKAYLAKLDVNALFSLADPVVEYRPLPKFPATTRDLSLVCNEELPIIEIEKAIRASAGSHLEDVKLFDVYQGAQIEEGKKSVSYSMVLRSAESTLTDAEADAAVKRVLKALEKMDVVLRA